MEQNSSDIFDPSSLIDGISRVGSDLKEKAKTAEIVATEEKEKMFLKSRADVEKERIEVRRLKKQAEKEKIEVDELEEKLTRLITENKTRIYLIWTLLGVTVAWMIVLVVFLREQACGRIHLSDGVMITLITTTTTQVLGFFYLVLRYLFNERNST